MPIFILSPSNTGFIFGVVGVVLTVIMILSYGWYKRNKYRTGQQLLRDAGVIPVSCTGYINDITDVTIETAWARLPKLARIRKGKLLARVISIRLIDELKSLSDDELKVELKTAVRTYRLVTGEIYGR